MVSIPHDTTRAYNSTTWLLSISPSSFYVQGLHVEGIFRRSGSSATIERLLREFNETREPDCIALDTIPVHTIAGLFKRFLQQLSEPVIPRSYQPEFLHIFESTTGNKKCFSLSYAGTSFHPHRPFSLTCR